MRSTNQRTGNLFIFGVIVAVIFGTLICTISTISSRTQAPAAQPATPPPATVQAQPAIVIIDLDATVPAKLELTVGQEVFFVRKSQGIGLKLSGTTNIVTSNFTPQVLFELQFAHEIAGQFKATAAGNGSITIARIVVSPVELPYQQSIDVTVR